MGGEPTAKRKAQKGQIMTTTTTNELTMRKFFEAVISGNITDDVIAKAHAEIAKLDTTNAKRAEKAAEKAKENEPIKQAIFEFLRANGTKTTAEIAAGVEVLENSSPKASAMCRQMVEEGRLTATEVKVPKKGKQKAYTAVLSDEGEDAPVQVTDTELNTMF